MVAQEIKALFDPANECLAGVLCEPQGAQCLVEGFDRRSRDDWDDSGTIRGQLPNLGSPSANCAKIAIFTTNRMARMARVVAAGVPHHITQRGNNRQDVFLLDDDRRFYLETLRERSRRHRVTLLGYCLMTNHVHLVAIPERPNSLALALGQCHSRYAQHFNRRYERTGHLWQNRFYSCPLGRTHLVRALLYVDLNPVRAGLVGQAEEYPWSSARAHAEGADSSGTLDFGDWSEICSANDWGEALADGADLTDEIRAATRSGNPFGDDHFVAELEQRAGRSLRRKPPGPPPKSRSAGA